MCSKNCFNFYFKRWVGWLNIARVFFLNLIAIILAIKSPLFLYCWLLILLFVSVDWLLHVKYSNLRLNRTVVWFDLKCANRIFYFQFVGILLVSGEVHWVTWGSCWSAKGCHVYSSLLSHLWWLFAVNNIVAWRHGQKGWKWDNTIPFFEY